MFLQWLAAAGQISSVESGVRIKVLLSNNSLPASFTSNGCFEFTYLVFGIAFPIVQLMHPKDRQLLDSTTNTTLS